MLTRPSLLSLCSLTLSHSIVSDGDPHSSDEDNATPLWARPLPFEEVAQAPFDVGQVPDYQQVDDPVPQQDVLAAIQRETRSDRNYAEEFNSRSVYDRRLSSLEMYCKEDRAGHAISWLKERGRLVVDQQYLLPRDDPDVIPYVKDHFIDFVLYMGNRTGLDALLPPPQVLVHHVFHVTWSFSQRNKLWSDSVGIDLSFSTTGRMIFLGKRFQEEIWIAFPPRGLFEDNNQLPDMAPLNAPTTALDPRHQYMFIMFCAYLFAKLHVQDVHCTQRYPEPLTQESVRQSTDILLVPVSYLILLPFSLSFSVYIVLFRSARTNKSNKLQRSPQREEQNL